MHALVEFLLCPVCDIPDARFRTSSCAPRRRRAAADLEDTKDIGAEEIEEDERDY